MNQIITQHNTIAQVQFYTSIGKDWQKYFSIEQALADVYMHIQALPSSLTPEAHTKKAYDAGLRHFLDFMVDQLPTHQLVNQYIALLRQSGRSASTISSKYLAPTRLFLSKLADQRPIGLRGDERDFAYDCQDQITRASRVKSPRPDTTNYDSPLFAVGQRISKSKVQIVMRHILTNTKDTPLLANRDYALIVLAFGTGLRLAEIQRLTLSNFYEDDNEQWWIKVRGKRSNTTPIPIDAHIKYLVDVYVDSYNAASATPITAEIGIWQPILKNGCVARTAPRGISTNSISDIMAKWTKSALGFALAPHDFRRTFATLALKDGWDIVDISRALRHNKIATTALYVGAYTDTKRKTVRLI